MSDTPSHADDWPGAIRHTGTPAPAGVNPDPDLYCPDEYRSPFRNGENGTHYRNGPPWQRHEWRPVVTTTIAGTTTHYVAPAVMAMCIHCRAMLPVRYMAPDHEHGPDGLSVSARS